MPPKKKKKNICITKQSDSVLNYEWIPGSEMVFETPDTNPISKSRRFMRSLQSFEKEDFSKIPDKLSQPLISPGMKTRLRRHSLIVGKSGPNVSFVNSCESISVAKTSSMLQTSYVKRLSSSKLITMNKSSDSVLKMSSSKTTTFDPSPTSQTMKRNKKAENSTKHTKVLNKDNADNLLDTDEISAIIVNLHDKHKRKSNISVIDTEEKTKLIKLSIQCAETNPIKRSFRIANMERDETVAEDNTSKDKILNRSFQKTKAKKIKNNESFAENLSKHRMLNKKHCMKRAKMQKETGAKNPISIREEYKEKNVKEVDQNRKVPKQMPKSSKSSIKRQSAKRVKDVKEVNAETQEKESLAKNRTSKRQSIRNRKGRDDPNIGVKMLKTLKEVSRKQFDTMDEHTKERNVKEVDQNRKLPKQTPRSSKFSIKRQSAKRVKDVKKVNVETQEKESPAKNRTSKRQSIRNRNVEWRKEKIVVVKRTPQRVKHKSEVEKDIESKITSEKMKNSSTNAIILTNECSKRNISDIIMSEQTLNGNNVKKYAAKLSVARQNYDTVKEESTEKLMYEQMKEEQKKVMVNKTITRNVTKQMASTIRKEKAEKFKTVNEKTLLEKVDRNSFPKMKVTKFDSQGVIEPENISHLSSKSRKCKKYNSYRNSSKNSFSLHRVIPDKIDEKKITSKNASSKDSKSSQRKRTRSVSLKKINEKIIVIDEDEATTCKKKKATDNSLSAKEDSEKNPLKFVSVDILTEKRGNFVPKTTTKKQNSVEENVESCKSVNWSLNSLFNSVLVGKGQAELASKRGEASKSTNQKVAAVTEIFTNGMRGKLPTKKTKQFSSPLLSSTPDNAKQTKIDVKTSFASKLHKTVSNLSPFSIHKSFEYTRTSVDSSCNQTIEEAVRVQKVEHKLNNKKKTEVKVDEAKMKVNAGFESKEVKESSNNLFEKQIHYESQESDIEIEKPDPNVISNNDSFMLDSTDITAPAKSVYYESQQSDEEMSISEKNVFCESEANVNKDGYKPHVSEMSDLFAVPKIIHYESQQSEMEDKTCNMSQADLEEIPEDMSHGLKECKDVLQEMNEKVPNILEQDMMISDYIKCQYQSQQLMIEDDLIGKTLHYESEQSDTSVSEIMKDFKISKDEEEEKLDDIDIDYNVSYSNYGLKCIIL